MLCGPSDVLPMGVPALAGMGVSAMPQCPLNNPLRTVFPSSEEGCESSLYRDLLTG